MTTIQTSASVVSVHLDLEKPIISKPWDIIGWGIIGYVISLVIVVPVCIFLWIVITEEIRRLKRKRANAGKLRCESVDCMNKATRHTPLGYFCEEDWPNNKKKYLTSGSIAWAEPLTYMKEGPIT